MILMCIHIENSSYAFLDLPFLQCPFNVPEWNVTLEVVHIYAISGAAIQHCFHGNQLKEKARTNSIERKKAQSRGPLRGSLFFHQLLFFSFFIFYVISYQEPRSQKVKHYSRIIECVTLNYKRPKRAGVNVCNLARGNQR